MSLSSPLTVNILKLLVQQAEVALREFRFHLNGFKSIVTTSSAQQNTAVMIGMAFIRRVPHNFCLHYLGVILCPIFSNMYRVCRGIQLEMLSETTRKIFSNSQCYKTFEHWCGSGSWTNFSNLKNPDPAQCEYCNFFKQEIVLTINNIYCIP
jgi:hypothetical protein